MGPNKDSTNSQKCLVTPNSFVKVIGNPSGIPTRDKADIPTYNAIQKKVIELAPNDLVSISDDLEIALYTQPRDDHHCKFRISKGKKIIPASEVSGTLSDLDCVSRPLESCKELKKDLHAFLHGWATKTVIELLSNLSFVSPSKSAPFTGLLAQNLLAPVRLTQAKRPRVVAVTWSRDCFRVKLNVDGSSMGNPRKLGGGGIAHSNYGEVIFNFVKSFGFATILHVEVQAFYMG
ncbi:hypothetical protein ACH5RR_013244 [Cinchona calisaya]|uniref:Uncharacterized protein n=1 Tax=Cinchona calisaya TaxID=153742 RepID=A0ABD3A248_9GENT